MLKNKTIAVVVPAYNETKYITKTITTIPAFVDRIFVVDDKSQDDTVAIVEELAVRQPEKIKLIAHEKNQGVGAAIVTGYIEALKEKIDITAVMAGDAQMNPDELESLCLPIIEDRYDYVKGNRLIYGQSWGRIPKMRYLGNSGLSLLTKAASGYWQVADSQTGYTTISLSALKKLKTVGLDKIYKRYGMPNDILVRLNVVNARVKEVPIEPIYHADGKSGIKYSKVFFTIPWLLTKLFIWRMAQKYIIRDFHPLVFFYLLGLFLGTASIIFTIRLIWLWTSVGAAPPMTSLALIFCLVTSLQSFFFAMWFDMEYNRKLTDRDN